MSLLLLGRPPSPESLGSTLGPAATGLLHTLVGRFSLLCHLTGQHAASLTANLRRVRDVSTLLLLDHGSIFLDSYNECVIVGNASRSSDPNLTRVFIVKGTAALWATSM